MKENNMETMVNGTDCECTENAVYQALKLLKDKSVYVGANILQKHEFLGEENSCIYAGMLEAAFDCDDRRYFVEYTDSLPNKEKKQTTYKYMIYEINPITHKQVRIAKGQATIADLY